jgi:TatA/E family protein of Tat protein translocase
MGEVILILVIALVVFGPRKLPELGKSLGQAMSQFRRASEDFKRTWEQEVELDKVRQTDVVSSTSDSSYNYNDPYDPYGSASGESNEPEAARNGAGSTDSSSMPEPTAAETAAATETAAAAQPEKKHWI